MTARDDIIRRIRDANRDGKVQQVEGRYARASSLSRTDVIDLFAERVSDYRATVVRCTPTSASDAIATELSPLRPNEVLLSRGLDSRWIEAGVVDAGFSNFELDRFKAVVTTCAVSIAETGAIIHDRRDDGQGR